MISLSEIPEVTLSKPEPVSHAEKDFLICAKHWQFKKSGKISFVIIQNLFVDIETFLIKNDSHG